MKRNVVEDFGRSCGSCGHTKGEHYEAVLNPADNQKAKDSACRKDNCACKKFLSK